MFFEQEKEAAKGCYSHKPTCCPPAPAEHCCPKPPGTVLRIFIAPGTVINLFKFLEVSSPSGICLVVRVPLLAGCEKDGPDSLGGILDMLRKAGASVEVVQK